MYYKQFLTNQKPIAANHAKSLIASAEKEWHHASPPISAQYNKFTEHATNRITDGSYSQCLAYGIINKAILYILYSI